MEPFSPNKNKFCNHCQVEHPLTREFWDSSGRGYFKCKTRRRIRGRSDKHREKQRNYKRKRYSEDRDYREKVCESRRGNRKYLDQVAKRHRERKISDPQYMERLRARVRTDEHRRKRNKKLQEKRVNDPAAFIAKNLRDRLRRSLKREAKRGSAVRDLGCSIEFLKRHLESLFKPGMSWENYGRKGWHIDHIRPLARFDLTDRNQLLQAVHYTNLQPLWWYENLHKHAREM